MSGFPYTMGMVGFYIYFIMPALAQSFDLDTVLHGARSEVGGEFIAKSLLQIPHLSGIGPSLPGPFQIWNLMDLKSSFDLRLMNSSWSGPAETTVYQKGESVYLQVFASAGPAHVVYIQSCYVTPSSDPMDKYRSALILNKGCVSSKQSAIEFISRQRDSINLLLDTSRLRFSKIYVHCSMVFSSAVTPDTKSCNYNKSKSSWVELGGQTSVCKCCASKCKGPPSYGGPSNELKALVSMGPLTLMEEQHDGPSLFNSFNATSQIGSSTGMNRLTSGTFPSLVEKGWIIASGAVSGNSKNVSYSSPWLSQSVLSESVTFVTQDKGSASSLWLTGLLVDVPDPGLKTVINIPPQNSTAKLVGMSRDDGVPTQKVHTRSTSEEHQEAHDWKSLIPERVSDVYIADSPALLNEWDSGDDALEGFYSPEEELRGDVFMNYKWPQHYDKLNMDAFASPLLEKLSEKPQGEDDLVLDQKEKAVKKVKGDDFGKYIEETKLTFSRDLDRSSSLSYGGEERSPSMGEKVKTSKLEMEQRKMEEEGKLDLVSGLK